MKGETKKPLLIFVRGLPGAGKSDLVDLLLQLPSLNSSLRLDPDRVNFAASEFVEFVRSLPVELIPKKRVYRYLLRQAESALWREQRQLGAILVSSDFLLLDLAILVNSLVESTLMS